MRLQNYKWSCIKLLKTDVGYNNRVILKKFCIQNMVVVKCDRTMRDRTILKRDTEPKIGYTYYFMVSFKNQLFAGYSSLLGLTMDTFRYG